MVQKNTASFYISSFSIAGKLDDIGKHLLNASLLSPLLLSSDAKKVGKAGSLPSLLRVGWRVGRPAGLLIL